MALLFAVIIVGQPLSPAIGTAAAAIGDEQCEGLEGGLYVVSFGNIAKECAVQNQVANAVEDVKEAQDNQTRVDIYSAAIAQNSATDPFIAAINNRLEDSKTVAWTHGETELAEAYSNGTSLAVARADAKQAEDDYYANIQRNILAEWRAEVSAFESLNSRAKTEGIPALQKEDDVTATDRMFYTRGINYAYYAGVKNRTVTLANGSTVDIPAICLSDTTDVDDTSTNYCQYPGHTNTGDYGEVIVVSGWFDDSMNDQVFVDFAQYDQMWDKSVQMNKEIKNETNTYANRTYEAFQDGEINSTDVLSKVTALENYGTEGDSMSDVVAALAKMGVSAPDLASTGTMNVTHGGTVYNGLVMAESAPNGSWETGVTYNSSNIDGPIWIATTEGESVKVDGEFTITGIKNKDGESVTNVSTTKYVYRTSNTTEYAQLLDQMSDLREELEQREPSGSGGGGGGSGIPDLSDFSNRQLMIAAGAVVALGLLSKLGNQ